MSIGLYIACHKCLEKLPITKNICEEKYGMKELIKFLLKHITLHAFNKGHELEILFEHRCIDYKFFELEE